MTILYVNGCSYTANLLLHKHARYPSLLAWHLKWHLRDNSWPGSSNARIIRCAYKDCLKIKNNSSEKIFALVQLTHLFRTEIFTPNIENNDWLDLHDPFSSIKPTNEDLSHEQRQYADGFFKINTNESLMLQLMPQILGLIAFFKQHNIDYYIYFGPKQDFRGVQNNILFQELQKDPGVVDLIEFNMLDLTGRQKHPTDGGMQQIFEFFYEKLTYSANKCNTTTF